MKQSGGFFEKGKCLISAGHKGNNVQGIYMNNDVICVQHKGDCSCFALLLLLHIRRKCLIKLRMHNSETFNFSVSCFVIAARNGYNIYSATKKAHQLQEATFS